MKTIRLVAGSECKAIRSSVQGSITYRIEGDGANKTYGGLRPPAVGEQAAHGRLNVPRALSSGISFAHEAIDNVLVYVEGPGNGA
jgi:hypothetical protein